MLLAVAIPYFLLLLCTDQGLSTVETALYQIDTSTTVQFFHKPRGAEAQAPEEQVQFQKVVNREAKASAKVEIKSKRVL